MEDFLSAVVLIASSTVLIFMNVFFWNVCSKLVLKTSSNTFFADLLFSLFCLRIILYYVLPTITHLLLNWKNQNIDRVLPSEISTVYMVEVFSHFIYYITFYILCKRNKKDLSLIIRVDKTLKKIMLGILLLYVCFLLNNTQIISLSFCDSLWMFEPLISVIGSVLAFEQFKIMTAGGPSSKTQTAVYYIYETSFGHYKFGYGAAMSMILLIILAVLSYFQFAVMKDSTN